MPAPTVQSPPFGCTILGSGSHGNATVIHGPEGNLLLDEGFSKIDICRRLENVSIDPASLRAILITHLHGDHVHPTGCAAFAREFSLPVYFTQKVLPLPEKKHFNAPPDILYFLDDSPFDLCGVRIEPFMVSHDVPTVGFTFSAGGHRIGYATDLGFVSPLVKKRLTGCDLLVLESNYDTRMLRMSNRDPDTKRRIEGDCGHLGNTQSMNALEELLSQNTRYLVLAHISGECNDPELVANRTKERLTELDRRDVAFFLAKQDTPLPTFQLG